ncbi:MAG: hypothetical protein QW752_05355 [Thermoplasmata archaeon]
MCSVYYLDTNKRECILIRKCRRELGRSLADLIQIPREKVFGMSEKYTVEQKVQIVTESFAEINIAEPCRRYGVLVAQFHR